MIDRIEKILFKDIITTLRTHFGDQTEAWWLQGVPKGIRIKCDTQYNDTPGDRDRWQFLYFLDYYEIILHGQNWDLFKEYYNFYGKGKKAELPRWITRLNTARNVTHHAAKGPLSKKDVTYVRAVFELVKTHIEAREPVPGKRLIPEDEPILTGSDDT